MEEIEVTNFKLEKWKSEVCEYINSLNSQLKNNEEAKKLYYGFELIDGELKPSPEILFIGINPGKGIGKRDYLVKPFSERISYLDYFDNEYRYHLAESVIEILKLTGMSLEEVKFKLEHNCVKTNLYHIVTDSEKEIKQCLNHLGKDSFKQYYRECANFCSALIKLMSPKVVIFEGKSSYDVIVGDWLGQTKTWDKENEFGYFYAEKENIHYIGLKRNYSNIKSNKTEVAKLLKKIISKR